MNKIVSLYLANKNIPVKMDVVQGATAPAITFVLEDYTPNAGAQCQIYIKKKNSEVYRSCTLSGNEVTFEPTTTSFDEVGLCTAQLQITSGGKIAVSYRIHVMVEPNIIDGDAIEAVDDFSALQQAIIAVGDITEYKAQTTQNATDIESIKGKTDKLIIQSSVYDVRFGYSDETQSVLVAGDTFNSKLVVQAETNNGIYQLLAKEDALVFHDANADVDLFRLNGPYPKGEISISNLVATGYATTGGTFYFFFDTPRVLPSGAVLSDVQITSASIRGVGGAVVSSADITENIENLIRSTSGKPRVLLRNLTNNFVANSPAFLNCTLKFTLS